jgi:hypothetical protein
MLFEGFPDHQPLLASLGAATTHATVSKDLLLRVLEEHSGERTVMGATLQIHFQMTTPHPSVSTAIGPDVMLDLRGHDQPVTIRSADRGELNTLAVPVAPDHPA